MDIIIDVPWPLSNDLWIIQFQKVDTAHVKWAIRAGTYVSIEYEPWHEISNNVAFYMCRLRRACTASFKLRNYIIMVFSQYMYLIKIIEYSSD